MKLSLICIANDQKMYDEFLEDLAAQRFKDFELITAMNMNGEYKGAREAFNENAAAARGQYLMFIHPDIRFLDENALGDLAAMLDSEMPFGVLGVAGAAPDGKGGRDILTTIVQGPDKANVGMSISGAVPVQTLDECLFVVEREYFRKHPFSNEEGWHLYSVEYCLETIKDGLVNKAVPSSVWHLSAGGSLNETYMDQLEKLIDREKDNFELICTSVKPWKTRGRSAAAYRKYYYYKQLVKRKIK